MAMVTITETCTCHGVPKRDSKRRLSAAVPAWIQGFEGGNSEKSAWQSFYKAVCEDREGIAKTGQQLSHALPSLADKVQALLLHWEKKYKALWDQDRDAFFRCPFHSEKTCRVLLLEYYYYYKWF
jgi:hypothetical protein